MPFSHSVRSFMLTAYLYLISSSIFLCAMSLLRKEYQRREGSFFASIFFVFFSYAVMGAAGNAVAAVRSTPLYTGADGVLAGIAAAYAAVSFVSTVICVKGTQYGNVSVLIMFANLGQVTVSSAYGFVFDAENNFFGIWGAFGYLCAAAILLLSLLPLRGSRERAGNKKFFFLLCVVLFFFNGMALPLCSLATRLRPSYDAADFLTLSALFGAAFSGAATAVLCIRRRPRGITLRRAAVCGGLGVSYAAVCFASNLLAVLCTSLLPIVVQAPLSFCISVIVLAAADFIIYREKLTKGNVIQLILAAASNLFFAL